jgi:hypothetical protein
MSGTCGGRLIAVLFLCIALGQSAAQIPVSPQPGAAAAAVAPEMRFLEAATAMANTLTSWAYAMIAGSIIALLGTGYYRPAGRRTRLAYLTFLPAWLFLYGSIQAGTKIQGYYLGALLAKKPNFERLLIQVNDQAVAQTDSMRYGLIFFGLWLIVYLFWWIFNNEPTKEKLK